jgi:hypothetical protein
MAHLMKKAPSGQDETGCFESGVPMEVQNTAHDLYTGLNPNGNLFLF